MREHEKLIIIPNVSLVDRSRPREGEEGSEEASQEGGALGGVHRMANGGTLGSVKKSGTLGSTLDVTLRNI